jgi:hypothetical protein
VREKNDSPSSGAGSLTINGGTVELGGADAGAVTFAGTGKLDQPQNLTGTIAGIVPGGTLDLGGVSAASASVRGNMITVNEIGGQSLTFNVTGIPAGANVQIASDGHGGSDLTFTPRPTVVVAIDNTDVNVANPTATVTVTFSKAPSGFSLADTTAVGGTLSNLTGSGTTYTATFTAAPNTDISTASVGVIAGRLAGERRQCRGRRRHSGVHGRYGSGDLKRSLP